jgi:hypothetical protein
MVLVHYASEAHVLTELVAFNVPQPDLHIRVLIYIRASKCKE